MGPKEEYMKMATQNGKICYVCYNKYATEERNINKGKFKIDSYSFGNIVIDGKSYASDVIILKDRIVSNWWRKEGHALCLNDLISFIPSPQGGEAGIPLLRSIAMGSGEGGFPLNKGGQGGCLIIGTGASGMMKVLEEVSDYFNSKGIKVIEERTDEACKTYNSLCNSHDVSAALHLTC